MSLAAGKIMIDTHEQTTRHTPHSVNAVCPLVSVDNAQTVLEDRQAHLAVVASDERISWPTQVLKGLRFTISITSIAFVFLALEKARLLSW